MGVVSGWNDRGGAGARLPLSLCRALAIGHRHLCRGVDSWRCVGPHDGDPPTLGHGGGDWFVRSQSDWRNLARN